MTEQQLRRLTGLVSLAAVPLYVAALLLQGSPPADSAGGEQVLVYASSHRTGILVAIFLTGAVFTLALAVQAGLARLLRHAEAEGGLLAPLGLIGGVAWVVVALAGLGFMLALVYRIPAGDPRLARLLLDLSLLSFTLSAFPTVLNVGAFSLLMLRSPHFPRWVSWLGFLAAGMHLVAGASFAQHGLFSPSLMANLIAPALYTLWALATGIVLLWRAAEPAAMATGRAEPLGITP